MHAAAAAAGSVATEGDHGADALDGDESRGLPTMPMTALDASAFGLFDDGAAQARAAAAAGAGGSGDRAFSDEEMATMRVRSSARELPTAPPGAPHVASRTLQGVGLDELGDARTGASTPAEMPLHIADLSVESMSPATSGLPTLRLGMTTTEAPTREAQQQPAGTTLPPQPLTALENAALERAVGADQSADEVTAVKSGATNKEPTDEVPTAVKAVADVAVGRRRMREPTDEAAAAKTAPMDGLPSMLDDDDDATLLDRRSPSTPTLPPDPDHVPNPAAAHVDPPADTEPPGPTPRPPSPRHGLSTGPTDRGPSLAAGSTGPAPGQGKLQLDPYGGAPHGGAAAVAGSGSSNAEPYEVESPSRGAGYRENQQTMTVTPVTPKASTRVALVALWSLAIGAAITAVVLLLLLK